MTSGVVCSQAGIIPQVSTNYPRGRINGAALDRVLDYIRTKPFGTSDRVALTCNKDNPVARVALTCNKDNPVARKLYENKGFRATGVEDEDEIELVLTIF